MQCPTLWYVPGVLHGLYDTVYTYGSSDWFATAQYSHPVRESRSQSYCCLLLHAVLTACMYRLRVRRYIGCALLAEPQHARCTCRVLCFIVPVLWALPQAEMIACDTDFIWVQYMRLAPGLLVCCAE
jgi:hypothetical protein